MTKPSSMTESKSYRHLMRICSELSYYQKVGHVRRVISSSHSLTPSHRTHFRFQFFSHSIDETLEFGLTTEASISLLNASKRKRDASLSSPSTPSCTPPAKRPRLDEVSAHQVPSNSHGNKKADGTHEHKGTKPVLSKGAVQSDQAKSTMTDDLNAKQSSPTTDQKPLGEHKKIKDKQVH